MNFELEKKLPAKKKKIAVINQSINQYHILPFVVSAVASGSCALLACASGSAVSFSNVVKPVKYGEKSDLLQWQIGTINNIYINAWKFYWKYNLKINDIYHFRMKTKKMKIKTNPDDFMQP